jgi:hypothetical protein
MAAGAIYQAELAHQLSKRLGLKISPNRAGFHIVGVPKELSTALSRRSAQIKKVMAENGFKTARAASIAAMNTRGKKVDVSLPKVLEETQRVMRAFGFGPEQVIRLVEQGRERQFKPDQKGFEQRFEKAWNRIFKEKRTNRRLVAIGRYLALQHGVSSDSLSKVFREHMVRPRGFVHVEWRQLFPKAPLISPVRKIKAPVLVIGDKKQFRRWENIKGRKDLGVLQLRLQERNLFPNAPKWNPLSKAKIPLPRLVKTDSLVKKLFQSTKEKGHSHSY